MDDKARRTLADILGVVGIAGTLGAALTNRVEDTSASNAAPTSTSTDEIPLWLWIVAGAAILGFVTVVVIKVVR